MSSLKVLGLALFLVWEGYWAYVFATASVPDEKMDTVFAMLMAIFLPLSIAAAAGLIVLGAQLGRRGR
jgi:hypothetical protein